jgi:hypothetical protein
MLFEPFNSHSFFDDFKRNHKVASILWWKAFPPIEHLPKGVFSFRHSQASCLAALNNLLPNHIRQRFLNPKDSRPVEADCPCFRLMRLAVESFEERKKNI